MKAERRLTIVKEIEHWRRSKLLPDQYCDFLLNLYANPSDVPKRKHSPLFGKAARTISDATGKQWFYSFGIFTLISVVVLYFNIFNPLMQIGFIIGISLLLVWYGQRMMNKTESIGLISLSSGHGVLLLGLLYMLELYNYSEWYYVAGAIMICSIIWIVYGIKKKVSLFHLLGWIAFLFVYAITLNRLSFAESWYQIQLVWIPLAILFGWLSWFVHRYSKQVASVLFMTAIISWLLPEAYQIILHGFNNYFQLQLVIKIAAGGIILFILRKQWMVWVSE